MNSMDNLLQEIKVMSSNGEEEEYYPEIATAALTNSIIFYEPKKTAESQCLEK